MSAAHVDWLWTGCTVVVAGAAERLVALARRITHAVHAHHRGGKK